MLLGHSKKSAISKGDLRRKIQFQLTDNFLSLDEARTMKIRKLTRLILLIGKAMKVSLKRRDAKEIALYLKSNLEAPTKTVEKLWSFVERYVPIIKKIKTWIESQENNVIVFSYRFDKYDLMLN